jgi:hypothetical protein
MSGMTSPLRCLPLHWRPANDDARPTCETIRASVSGGEDQRTYVSGTFTARDDN